jgi:hypothetical protein
LGVGMVVEDHDLGHGQVVVAQGGRPPRQWHLPSCRGPRSSCHNRYP